MPGRSAAMRAILLVRPAMRLIDYSSVAGMAAPGRRGDCFKEADEFAGNITGCSYLAGDSVLELFTYGKDGRIWHNFTRGSSDPGNWGLVG